MSQQSSLRLCLGLLSIVARAHGASPAELKVQLGHSSPAKSVAISPDGHWLLTGSWDTTARLWELDTGYEIRRFEGHSDWLTAVAFSPDGRSILTACRDKTARLWDVATGREIRRFEGHTEALRAAAFAPDGRWIVTASEDKTARLWDVATGKEIHRFEGHTDKVIAVAFSPDGRFVLTGSDDKIARLWMADTGAEVRRFEGHSGWVASVAFSPDGRTVLTGSEDKTARLWETDTGHEIRRFQGFSYGTTSAAFAPDGRSVFIAGIGAVFSGNPGDARLWDAATGREIRRFDQGGWTTSATFSPDGRFLATTNSDATPRLWDVATGKEIRRFEGHSDSVKSAVFAPGGRSVFTVSEDKISAAGVLRNVGRLWDLETGRETYRFKGRVADVKFVAFAPDGRTLVTADAQNSPLLWDAATGAEIRRFTGHSQPVDALAFSPDGRWVLTGSRDKTARLWDAATGQEAGRFDHADRVNFVAFSPDGRSCLTGSADYITRLWDVATRREIHRFQGYARFTFSPDSRFVLIADKTARLCDVATGDEIRRFESPAGQISDSLGQKLRDAFMSVDFAAFSPDGHAVATIRSDGSAQVWEVSTGREICRLEGHTKRITAVTFAPDGRSVATASWDGTARLWDPATGREMHRLAGHTSSVNSVAFSPDSQFVVTGSSDGSSKIWSRGAGLLLATLIGFRKGGWAVVDPAGRYDASDPEHSPGLFWQVADEVIELKQLKDRFYAPNLLARALGFNSEPLPRVAGLNNLELWPIVQVQGPAPGRSVASVRLSDRGGGVGRVVVKVNGREIPRAIGGGAIKTGASIPIDLSSAELRPGGANTIEVIAYDKANLVAARGVQVAWSKTPGDAAAPPALHAIVAGASSYENPAMSLRFPAKDAAEMARALAVGGKRMFGVGRVDIALFATGTAHEPTKENIRDAFKEVAAKAGPSDVALVYFAGHGVAGRAGSDLYYYLTRDARSIQPEADTALWERTTISSGELREWLSRKGMPLRQVVVLDTCAAGAATAELLKLADRRELTADQRRALELLKDATGSHLLMGAAADKVSYEASRYGQGLLTYSLLLGMRGEALDEGGRLDVGKWFDTAQRKVPELAQGIGGIQQPVVSSPSGQTFPIALFTPEDQAQIRLPALKAQLLRARVEDGDQNDPLQLDAPVREGLRAASRPMARGETRAEPPLVYLDQVAGDVAGAYTPQVLYALTAGRVQVRLRLVRGQERMERTIEAARPDTAELAKRIVDEFVQMAASVKP